MIYPQAVLDFFARIGAQPSSTSRATIRGFSGKFYDQLGSVVIGRDGEVRASKPEFEPTKEEAAAIKDAWLALDLPKTINASLALAAIKTAELVASGGRVFEFYDRRTSTIVMLQHRVDFDNGTKAYIPWTLTSAGTWEKTEPDDKLPLWKPREPRSARVMIHEGAKAASAVEALLISPADHPWKEELALYEHWGMIGGTEATGRADYSELISHDPREGVYVCDNDSTGLKALTKVSRNYGRALKGIRFTADFPSAWDMADPFPTKLVSDTGHYSGPPLSNFLSPATWATEVVPSPTGKGRPLTVIRPAFAEEWLHSVSPEIYVHREIMPNRVLNEKEFNNTVAPFSNVDDTARLLRKEFSSKTAMLRYDPSRQSGVYSSDGATFINTFRPSSIKPISGDEGPWLDFMDKLVTDSGDRRELMRWCATLIARPDIKMFYGVLLISEIQGVGKSTLGEKILTPLVGATNASSPGESQIVDSPFNEWLAHKRLAVVHEIYAGHSSKAYDKLKSAIAETTITVNKKYVDSYSLDNWVHIFACSNSFRALKLTTEDRRWLVPRVTKKKQPYSYWKEINRWLSIGGGLNIIAYWAANWLEENEPVAPGVESPWTTMKKETIEEGYSLGQSLVFNNLNAERRKIDLAKTNGGAEAAGRLFTTDKALQDLIRYKFHDGRYSERMESLLTVRNVAKAAGWSVGSERSYVRDWGPDNQGARVVAIDPLVADSSPGELNKGDLITWTQDH